MKFKDVVLLLATALMILCALVNRNSWRVL